MRVYTKRTARLRDLAGELADEFRAEASRIDAEDRVPELLTGRLWDAGFMGLLVPKEHGGLGADMTGAAVVVEELARGCGSAGLLVLLQALATRAVTTAGPEKQAAKYCGRTMAERLILAFALSEPEAAPGDTGEVTRAKRTKGEYVIRGRKTFVSGARDADLVIVFAQTSPRSGLKKGLSALLVPAGTAGMLPGHEAGRAGLRGAPAVELVFEGCRVPASGLLGRAGAGYAIADKTLAACAPLAGALAAGLFSEALDYSLFAARRRKGEARPLSEHQPLELAVAEAMAGLDASRALVWAAAGAVDEGLPAAERLARESKWVATETAVSGIDALARLAGLEGSVKGSLLERLSRDARAAQLLLGPNHVHRIEVARKLLSRSSSG